MKPSAFEYYRPQTLSEALEILERVEDAKVLAGGQSLIPMMNMRLARPQALVDINQLPELTRIDEGPEGLTIGSLVRHYQLEHSPVVREWAPLITQAERLIGHPAIRSRGTIGGSLSHADPAAELPVLAVLGDWQIEVSSTADSHAIPASEFFLSYFITAAAPTDIVTAIQVPRQTAAGQIVEYAVRSGDFALAIAAVQVTVDDHGIVEEARVALGGVADIPWRNPELERQWVGQTAGTVLWREIAHTVAQEIEPSDDLHATASHRRSLAEHLIEQAFQQAADNGRTMIGQGRSQ